MELIEIKPGDRPKPEFGIIIMALGNPLYGQYAINLAAGLREVQKDINMALVSTQSAMIDITDVQKSLFNYHIDCPLDYYSFKDSTCYVKAKLFLDQLTPFKKTLFLDADMMWSPYHKPLSAIEPYKNLPFAIANRGEGLNTAGFSGWVDIDYIKQTYQVEKWYDLSSEWMYFDNSDTAKELFKTAREFYEDDKLLCKGFAGGKPDEPAIALAMLKLNIVPHKIPYYPNYWEPVQKNKPEQDIYKNYHGISMGGKFSSERITKIYNNLAKYYAMKTGIPTFQLNKPKGHILKERELI